MYKALSKLKSAVFCFLVLMVLLCSCKAQPTWQEQYDLGMRYLTESNYEQAILAFTAAIEINPNQAGAYVGRADAYVGWGDVAGENYLIQAQNDYEQALRLDDSIADVYLYLAEIYTQQGENEKAIDLLLRGYEITGDERLYREQEPSVKQKFAEGYFFKSFDSLPESGQQALRESIAALQRGDIERLEGLLKDSGIPTFLCTEIDEYLVKVGPGIEIRPEQGTGYSYEKYNVGEVGSTQLYWQFSCFDWQWNGPWYLKKEQKSLDLILMPDTYGSDTDKFYIEGFGTNKYYTEASGTAKDNKGIADSQRMRIESANGGWMEYRAENGFIVEISMNSIQSEMLDPDLGADPNSIIGSAVDMCAFEYADW